MKLIIRLILGIVAGVFIGLYAPIDVVRLLATFKVIFGQLLGFTVPLVILFYVMSGIGSMQKGSGRILGATLALAYLSTVGSGVMAFLFASKFIPMIIPENFAGLASGIVVEPFMTLSIPPLLEVITALVTAFMFGMGMSYLHSKALLAATDQARDIVELVLMQLIIPLLPLYICSVFAEMGASGTIFATLETFVWVLGLALVLHWIWLLVMFTIAGVSLGRNPLRMLRTMLPSYITAVGTLSSAATIPVTVSCARKLKLNAHVVDFSVPLCATIHLSGSAITLTVCAVAVTLITTVEVISLVTFLPFLMVLGVALVAAPGIPGGAVMASLGLLASMLGFDDSAIALMIALYVAQDSFGTACNVTGDGAITSIVDRIGSGRWKGDNDVPHD